jgi:hypothetical protein
MVKKKFCLVKNFFAQFSSLTLALISVLIYRVHEATERLVYSNRMNQLNLWYNFYYFYYFFTFLQVCVLNFSNSQGFFFSNISLGAAFTFPTLINWPHQHIFL